MYWPCINHSSYKNITIFMYETMILVFNCCGKTIDCGKTIVYFPKSQKMIILNYFIAGSTILCVMHFVLDIRCRQRLGFYWEDFWNQWFLPRLPPYSWLWYSPPTYDFDIWLYLWVLRHYEIVYWDNPICIQQAYRPSLKVLYHTCLKIITEI